MLKKIYYFSKTYKYDFLTAFAALILYILAFIFSDNQKILLILSIIITFIFFTIIIYIRFKEKDFYFIPLADRKNKDDWFGKGTFEYERTEKCFLITNSDSGYIYSKSLIWSDYQFSCKFKIISECLGVIVRAINLSNYVMLQITPNGIRPHIRINGGWYSRECHEVNLCFTTPLSLDRWYKFLFYCEKDTISIKLFEGENEIFDRKWEIPQGSVIFRFTKGEGTDNVDIPFPINLEYGSIGFRNCGDEKSLVKDLLIEKN